MVDEAKLHSLIHSTFEVVVVRHAVGCCHAELGLWCRPMVARGVAVFGASHEFAELTVGQLTTSTTHLAQKLLTNV